jgi:hypothetical protein
VNILFDPGRGATLIYFVDGFLVRVACGREFLSCSSTGFDALNIASEADDKRRGVASLL